MPYFPTIPETYTTQQVTDVFRGLNHKLKIGDGEFSDMENLTSDHYPLLANRKKRSIVLDILQPRALLGKEKLWYIDGDKLFCSDTDVTGYFKDKGCVIADREEMLPKTLCSMGAYILIFPDRLYINTQDFTDCGSMEQVFESNGSSVSYAMCRLDGTEYDAPTLGDQMPENPENGALWVDPYAETKTLNQYNSNTDTWEPIPTVYTKISCPGIHEGFKQYDGVRISGCAVGADIENRNQVEALNGSKIIYGLGDNYIIVVGLLDMPCNQMDGSGVTVSRTVPDMDFITEAENRLWGCKYGFTEDGPVNEIYCCALGDFKNWEQYLGLATDSWRGSVGTDGGFTGAITHNGYPLFFKEDCLHKVYISSTGAHRVVETQCRGVQAGSHRSLAIVNETLFYKSAFDICAYDGTLPVSVSEALGDKRYFDAAAGAYGDKYYISMHDNIGNWEMFVFDTSNGLWHREDDTHAMQFADSAGVLFFLDEHGRVQCVDDSAEGQYEVRFEDDIHWRAVTGLMGYGTVEQKYISRFNLRMQLPKDSIADLYIEYDSDGVWHHAGHMVGTGTKTFMLPVRPRRCDHFRIKLTGVGDVRVYSFAKIFEAGSDM